jgi:hypothetical protein
MSASAPLISWVARCRLSVCARAFEVVALNEAHLHHREINIVSEAEKASDPRATLIGAFLASEIPLFSASGTPHSCAFEAISPWHSNSVRTQRSR